MKIKDFIIIHLETLVISGYLILVGLFGLISTILLMKY